MPMQDGPDSDSESGNPCPEPALYPDLPVIDSHHHLYDRPQNRYLEPDYLADITTGHTVRASVFVQARSHYRSGGPELWQPLGETDYASDVAERFSSGTGPQLCAGVVGYADLTAGDAVRPILEAHILAGKGRFRGIRHILAWDQDSSLLNPAYPTTEDMTATAQFLEGFSHLQELGLSFDAWMLFPQLPRLVTLARRFPETQFILDHCGGIVGIGSYSGAHHEVFIAWRKAMAEIATCSNISVKIGGLGMALSGFGFQNTALGPSHLALADAWKPWIYTCFELFGAERCMFGSNFPADKPSYSFHTGLNAMKRLSAGLSSDERWSVFCGTALKTYRLVLPR